MFSGIEVERHAIIANLDIRSFGQVFLSLEDLTVTVLEQFSFLEKDPKLVQIFFHKKEVAFFTN